MDGLRRLAAPLVVAGSLLVLTASATATGATLRGEVDPNGHLARPAR